MKNVIKILILSFVVIIFASCNESLADEPCSLPVSSSMKIHEKFTIFRTTLSIDGEDLEGKVVREFWSWNRKFNLFINDEYVGTGIKSILHIGTEIKIYDCDGSYLGKIVNEDQLKNAFRFDKVYSIYNMNDDLIASSKKRSIIGSTIELSKDDEVLANIKRPTRFKTWNFDKWEVNLHTPNTIDSRFLMFFTAFETQKQNKSGKSSSSSSSSKSSSSSLMPKTTSSVN